MQEVIDIIENTKDLLQQKKPEGFEGMIDELTRASALVTTEYTRLTKRTTEAPPVVEAPPPVEAPLAEGAALASEAKGPESESGQESDN